MKNTQLRIGNKVLHNGVVKTVDLISPGYIAFLEDRPNKDSFGEWVDLDDVEFIELTEEILLECGFIAFGQGYIHENMRYTDLFKIREDGFIVFVANDNYITKIKHLHQLQNLYYALKNKELEINL